MSVPQSKQAFGSANLVNQDDYSGFPAGIILNTSPERIPNSGLQRATNAEYDASSAVLRKCDGVLEYLDAEVAVESGYEYNGKKVFNSGQNLYYTDGATKTLIGTLEGELQPSYTPWTDELLIASGGKLQHLNTSWTLATYVGSPNCDKVWMRYGRANVSLAGDDFIYESAIGDPSQWDTSPQAGNDWTGATASDPKFYEVGYQDGLDIVAVDWLGPDLLVSKSDGKRFQQYIVKGAYPDWDIQAVPSCPVYHSVSANNDVYMIGPAGFKAIKSVIQRGDYQQDETGLAVNAELLRNGIDSHARVWHIASKKQIAVKCQNDKAIWLWHYTVYDPATQKVGAWTRREFVYNVSHIWEDAGAVYVAYGNKIGRLDAETDTDDGNNFTYDTESGRKVARLNYSLTHVVLNLESRKAGTGTIQVGTWRETLNFNASDDIAFSDTDEAYSDTDPAVGQQYMRFEWFLDELMPDYTVKLTCETGSIGFRSITLDVAEV